MGLQLWTGKNSNYEIASSLLDEPKALRTVTLLTCIGADALKVFDGFVFDNDNEEKDMDVVLRKCWRTTMLKPWKSYTNDTTSIQEYKKKGKKKENPKLLHRYAQSQWIQKQTSKGY